MPRPANPQVRSRILESGADLVGRYGFGATGVQEIAAAASVPKGSFYSYFDSKEAFGIEILEAYWSEIVTGYGPVLRDEAIPPLVRLERYFACLVAFHAQKAFAVGCLIGNLSLEMTAASEAIRAKLVAIFDEWARELAGCLCEAQARREIAPDADLTRLARAMIDAFEGAVMQAKVTRDAAPFERFQQVVLPSLLR